MTGLSPRHWWKVMCVSESDVAIVAAQILDVDDDELVSISEAARRLDMYSSTIWQWHRLGWLKEHGRGSNRVIFVSWRQVQALEELHRKHSKRGQRLIPRDMEVHDSIRSLL
jgi:transposase-like protein